MIRSLLILTMLVSGSSAFACLDLKAKPINTRAVLRAHANSLSFQRCMQKIEDVGGTPANTSVTRRDRDEGDTSPELFTYRFVGKDGEGRAFNFKVQYTLKGKRFVCGDVSYRFTRGCN